MSLATLLFVFSFSSALAESVEEDTLLSDANKLFLKREENFTAIDTARARYLKILPKLSFENKLKAYVRLARLDTYEALITPESDSIKLKGIFERCLTTLEPLANSNRAEYLYWVSGCLGGWAFADQGHTIESLWKINKAWKLLKQCLSTNPRYEGGGCYRIVGAILGGAPPINPTGPSRDLVKAREYLEIAIQSESSDNIDSGYSKETASGSYYYHVYYLYALVLDAEHDRPGAIAVIEEALDRLSNADQELLCSAANNLPCGREPETRAEKKQLQKLLTSYRQ